MKKKSVIGLPGTDQLFDFLQTLSADISVEIVEESDEPIQVICEGYPVSDTEIDKIQILAIRISDGKLYVLDKTGNLKRLKDFGYPLEMIEASRDSVNSIWNTCAEPDKVAEELNHLKEQLQ